LHLVICISPPALPFAGIPATVVLILGFSLALLPSLLAEARLLAFAAAFALDAVAL